MHGDREFFNLASYPMPNFKTALRRLCYFCRMRILLTALLSLLFLSNVSAHVLKPGFDKAEYIELLRISALQGDADSAKGIPQPEHSKRLYRSEIVGMDNRWDLYMRDDNVAIISIRGTTAKSISWVENLYSAMVPAKGSLILSDNYTLNYDLADNPKAGVHIGWLIGMGFLVRDMLPKIDSVYNAGVRDVIIMGHSQGGAITYLLTSHLYRLQQTGNLPKDIRFKTYCSAAPKPGNLYYAYDYEAWTEGWEVNVVNSADWVPEVPVSVQTVDDFNNINPFSDISGVVAKQKFPKNLALRYAYNRVSKPGHKAQKRYRNYFGDMVSKNVRKHIKEFKTPKYLETTHYVRTGRTIVLKADEAYYKRFPDNKEKLFGHHFMRAYLYLTQKLPDDMR